MGRDKGGKRGEESKNGEEWEGEGWKKVEESERSVVRGGIVGGGGTEGSAYAFHPPPACHQLTSSTYAPIHVPFYLSTVLHHLRPLVISFAFLRGRPRLNSSSSTRRGPDIVRLYRMPPFALLARCFRLVATLLLPARPTHVPIINWTR